MEQRSTSAPAPAREAEAESEQPGGAGRLMGEQLGEYSRRWDEMQAAFVDEPRRAVEEADRLVAEVIDHLSSTFTSERKKLEGHWSRGDQVSTEDLRVALQRYRRFFHSLLR
jgi:hypothetical protein